MPPKSNLPHLTNPQALVTHLWQNLSLPPSSLSALQLSTPPFVHSSTILSSSFKVDLLATSTIALFNLLVSHYKALHSSQNAPLSLLAVTVNTLAASLEFKCERLYTLNGTWPGFESSIGGLHKTRDGYVRIHDGFEVHRAGIRLVLGLAPDAGRAEVAAACAKWDAQELEAAGTAGGAVLTALRTEEEWEGAAMGEGVADNPISVRSLGTGAGSGAKKERVGDGRQCLSGVRVIEFSRVIAAPVAGRALATHGADVLWVTSEGLEDQPVLDVEFSRGKRTVRLDLDNPKDLERVKALVRDADVFIQGYRPGSLAKKGLGLEDLRKINPRLVYASMSAYPQVEQQPWRERRGFDSLVQTCSGINVAEADAWNVGKKEEEQAPARVLPCQALDHASGFLLAAGIVAALCRRSETGEGQLVEVSLAGTSKLLRSLGQKERFETGQDPMNSSQQVLEMYGPKAESLFVERVSELGKIKFLKHAGHIWDAEVGPTRMPRPLGSDEPVWLR